MALCVYQLETVFRMLRKCVSILLKPTYVISAIRLRAPDSTLVHTSGPFLTREAQAAAHRVSRVNKSRAGGNRLIQICIWSFCL